MSARSQTEPRRHSLQQLDKGSKLKMKAGGVLSGVHNASKFKFLHFNFYQETNKEQMNFLLVNHLFMTVDQILWVANDHLMIS